MRALCYCFRALGSRRMTDKDREAFERWFYAEKPAAHWETWQAARDHYAPKLTEKEALERAAQAIAPIAWDKSIKPGNWDRDDAQKSARDSARRALRAAGV